MIYSYGVWNGAIELLIKESRLFEFNLKGLDSRELINAWQIHAPTYQIHIIQLATEETWLYQTQCITVYYTIIY